MDEENIVSGYVLDDGEVVTSAEINKARTSKATSSNAMDTDIDDFGEWYSAGAVYKPPVKLQGLKGFSLENTYHQACMEQIATDCCSGWSIVPLDKYGNDIPEPERKRNKVDNLLYDFFNNCIKDGTFTEFCQQLLIDFQTYGWMASEMTRDKAGRPKSFYYIPTETVRIARDLSNYINTDQRYALQIVNNHERIFKLFSNEKFTPMVEPNTESLMTELLLMKHYHVDGGKYGIPTWFTAIKSMVGNDKVAEYNINFFNNEAVPRFAVVVTGGKLDNDTKKVIQNYFKKDLKGVQNAHKTLVLTGPKGIDIKLVPLANDVKDGSFRLYRKDNRDEIIHAHRVPPHRLQILDAGSSGTMSSELIYRLDRIYKFGVVKPMQTKLSTLFNNVLRYGFGITDRVLRFDDLDIGEDNYRANILKTMAAAHEKYYSIGAMLANDVRSDLKLPQYNKNTLDMKTDQDIYDWATTPRPVYLIRQAQIEAQNQLINSTQGNGLNTNTASGNLNETANSFDDKSREQTQGNAQFNDEQMSQLMMKREVTLKVLKQLDEELFKSMNQKEEE
jgi:PBSX family phage portal protein